MPKKPSEPEKVIDIGDLSLWRKTSDHWSWCSGYENFLRIDCRYDLSYQAMRWVAEQS